MLVLFSAFTDEYISVLYYKFEKIYIFLLLVIKTAISFITNMYIIKKKEKKNPTNKYSMHFIQKNMHIMVNFGILHLKMKISHNDAFTNQN